MYNLLDQIKEQLIALINSLDSNNAQLIDNIKTTLLDMLQSRKLFNFDAEEHKISIGELAHRNRLTSAFYTIARDIKALFMYINQMSLRSFNNEIAEQEAFMAKLEAQLTILSPDLFFSDNSGNFVITTLTNIDVEESENMLFIRDRIMTNCTEGTIDDIDTVSVEFYVPSIDKSTRRIVSNGQALAEELDGATATTKENLFNSGFVREVYRTNALEIIPDNFYVNSQSGSIDHINTSDDTLESVLSHRDYIAHIKFKFNNQVFGIGCSLDANVLDVTCNDDNADLALDNETRFSGITISNIDKDELTIRLGHNTEYAMNSDIPFWMTRITHIERDLLTPNENETRYTDILEDDPGLTIKKLKVENVGQKIQDRLKKER